MPTWCLRNNAISMLTANPVTHSEPPVPKRSRGIALTPAQQVLVFESATGPWCMATFLEVGAATGARRGEVLALRWSDLQDGRAIITRSLTQTRQVLEFKDTKTERPRDVKVPASALATLEEHRKRQNEFRQQFGPEYRADLDLIFANPDGTPLRPNSVSSVVSLLFRRLGLPKGASLHSLRHSHGSHLLADGVPQGPPTGIRAIRSPAATSLRRGGVHAAQDHGGPGRASLDPRPGHGQRAGPLDEVHRPGRHRRASGRV